MTTHFSRASRVYVRQSARGKKKGGEEDKDAPVWAVAAAIALPFGVEGTYMWPVPFVVGFGSCQLLEHLPTCRRRPTFVQLVIASSELTKRKAIIASIYIHIYLRPTVTHRGLLILRVVLPVDVARGRLVRDAERGVADLRREVVLEVEEARLAHVACLGAGLADHRRLEAHACARVPAEDREGARARSAFPPKLLL